MNLGGTEKSFLNLISELPDHYSIDLLLLEHKGELLKDLPANVNVRTIENSKEINEFLNKGSRRFAFEEFKRRKYYSSFHNLIIFILYKLKVVNHPFYGVSSYLKNQNGNYDYAVAFAGIHNFIAYYTLKHIKAKKKYLWVHFDVTKISFNKRFANYFYPYFNKIICVSQLVKDNLVNSVNSEIHKKIEIIHNVLDTSDIDRKKNIQEIIWDNNVINILTVGRLSQEKGHFDFLPIIEKLKNENLKFKWWIIGDGNERSKIENKIKELKLSSFIELLGKKENPFPYYKACDVYLQPSRYEGHCVSIIEAKYFNKPIVSNNFAGVSDEIENNLNGLICEMNFESQYNALSKIIKQKELRIIFSENLKRENRKSFTNPFV
ncbi:glycosyltransferase [Aequorivita sinensis]|uniref:glycosyltransferase n=1 Tax=Aequorivita sinensis TaxID=1382458 RepID=UPI002300A576|nr:glycosyltransferase [Aequorivita sinensis]